MHTKKELLGKRLLKVTALLTDVQSPTLASLYSSASEVTFLMFVRCSFASKITQKVTDKFSLDFRRGKTLRRKID